MLADHVVIDAGVILPAFSRVSLRRSLEVFLLSIALSFKLQRLNYVVIRTLDLAKEMRI